MWLLRSRSRVLLLFCLLMLAMAAPGAVRAATTPWTLRVGLLEEPPSPNPFAHFAKGGLIAGNHAVNASLFLSLAGPFGARNDYVPVLATRPVELYEMRPVNFDGRTLVAAQVPLRRDLRWSDGTPLTARDVAFTYNSVLQIGPEKLGGYWTSLVPGSLLVGVEATDLYTATFWMQRVPGLGEWRYGLLSVPIVQEAAWRPLIEEALRSADPVRAVLAIEAPQVTLGPWLAASPSERLRNERDIRRYEKVIFFENGTAAVTNPLSHFEYREDGIGGRVVHTLTDQPFERIEFRTFQSASALVAAKEKGDVDAALFSGTPGSAGEVALYYLGFNLARGGVRDAALRRAISLLTRRSDVIGAWTGDDPGLTAQPAYSLVPPQHAAWYLETPWEDEEAGRSPGAALSKAVAILEAGGYSWARPPRPDAIATSPESARGVVLRTRSGEVVGPLTLVSPSEEIDPLAVAFADHVASNLRLLGVDVTVERTGREGLRNLIADPGASSGIDLWVTSWLLASGAFPQYLALAAYPQTGLATDATFIARRDDLMQAPNAASARARAQEMQRYLAQNAVITPLAFVTLEPASESVLSLLADLSPRRPLALTP